MNCSFFFSLFMLCSSSITPGPSRPWRKTLPLPFSCIMTDCKGVCVPVCHAWPYCLTLDYTVCCLSVCSLLSCQASYTLLQFSRSIYFPFHCKQVFVLHTSLVIVLWISRVLWNSIRFLYYHALVWLVPHFWDVVLLLFFLSLMQSELTHMWRINRKYLTN